MMPILALLVMGVIDLGLMGRQHQIVQNAAREGARYSSLPRSELDPNKNPSMSLAIIKGKITSYCASEGIPVAVNDITVNQAHQVNVGASITIFASRVTVSTSYTFITPGLSSLLGNTTLAGEGIYRNLY